MTEEEARKWVEARFDQDAVRRLDRLARLVAAENARQNLVAPSTIDSIWARHIVDSLQLVALAQPGSWLDIGTGAGFPGLAVAIVETGRQIFLVEPRPLRADFLQKAAEELRLSHVRVIGTKVEKVRRHAEVISARAVARIATLFAAASDCAGNDTLWLLPKGAAVQDDVAEAQRTWHGMFHVEQSITNSRSAIVIVRNVSRR